jgi:hypothetical protein
MTVSNYYGKLPTGIILLNPNGTVFLVSGLLPKGELSKRFRNRSTSQPDPPPVDPQKVNLRWIVWAGLLITGGKIGHAVVMTALGLLRLIERVTPSNVAFSI